MTAVSVLGAMRVERDGEVRPRVSGALQHLIGVLVAAGPSGISKDEIAAELWGDERPQSWKSMLRNRITKLRKLLGSESVLNLSTRYQLSSLVSVDSWRLLALPTNHGIVSDGPLGFLDGEPFAGIQSGPMLVAHAALIEAHRAARIQHLVSQTEALAPLTLQSLRAYQARHALDSTTTQQTVLAHFRAQDPARAVEIIEFTRQQATQAGLSAPWIDQLEELESTGPDATGEPHASASGNVITEAEQTHFRMRAEIFSAAAESNDWNMAFEIAMNGLPEAEKINGDPERLKLLESIPIEVLDAKKKFALASTLAKQYLLVHQAGQAYEWARIARGYAQSVDDELVVFLVGAVVGDSDDERSVLQLPEAFDQSTDLVRSMRALQAAVVSHLERSPAVEAAAMVEQLMDLATACPDPFRRWHTLLLKATLKFVAGEWEEAQAASDYAHKYGELCGAADASPALVGQSLNPSWVHPDFLPAEVPPSYEGTPIDLAMYAALRSDVDVVDAYLDDFDCESRAYFVPTMLVFMAHKVRSPINRRRVRSRLQRRSGTSAILGSGALHFGPVDRALAMLADDPDERDHWSASAIDVADIQQTRVWQVACRLERAALTNDATLIAEARKLAKTPFLQRLIAASTR